MPSSKRNFAKPPVPPANPYQDTGFCRTGRQVGEKNVRAKLTEADVVELRRLGNLRSPHGVPSYTITRLAELFGVAHNTVSVILNGLRWTHIEYDNLSHVRGIIDEEEGR